MVSEPPSAGVYEAGLVSSLRQVGHAVMPLLREMVSGGDLIESPEPASGGGWFCLLAAIISDHHHADASTMCCETAQTRPAMDRPEFSWRADPTSWPARWIPSGASHRVPGRLRIHAPRCPPRTMAPALGQVLAPAIALAKARLGDAGATQKQIESDISALAGFVQ